ncbi:MAG: hypothetical protein ACRYGR_05125 [Janthinobacterium lividum]
MAKIVTYGLMASSAALAAALPHSGVQQPMASRPQLGRRPSRFDEDMQQVGLRRRDDVNWQQATADVNWDNALEGVDWSKVDYSGAGAASASPVPKAQATPITNAQMAPAAQQPMMAPAAPAAPASTTLATQVAPSPSAAATDAPAATAAAGDYFAGIDETHNAVAIVWKGDYDATFNVYANNGPYQPGLGAAYKTVTVKAGSNGLVTLPDSFSGRVQLMSGAQGKADDDATWAEIAFQQWQGLTFFDISCIRGVNAGLTMAASDGSQTASIPANIMEMAPQNIKIQDSGGKWVIQDTEGYDGSLHQGSIDWLHSQFKISDAYVRNFEDESTKSTKDRHLTVTFSV